MDALESRLAQALDHAHLYLCMIETDIPTYHPELTQRIKRELSVVLDEAELAGLLPVEQE